MALSRSSQTGGRSSSIHRDRPTVGSRTRYTLRSASRHVHSYHKVRGIGQPWGKHPPPISGPTSCKGCLFPGVNAHQALCHTKRAWWHLFVRHFGSQNRKYCFYLDKLHMPSTILLPDSSTVLVSKSCAKGARNIPWAFTTTNSVKFGATPPSLFHDQSSVQGG